MNNKIIHSEHLRENLFFEISGLPGRLYLEAFAFGHRPPLIISPFRKIDQQLAEFQEPEESPLTLYPDERKLQSSPLLRTPDNQPDPIVTQVVEKIGTCSIGAEPKNGSGAATTLYLFFKCHLRGFWNQLPFPRHPVTVHFQQHNRTGTPLTKGSW